MSIEPVCDFCGLSDKNRCKTLTEALGCQYTIDMQQEIIDKKPAVYDFGFSFESEQDISTPAVKKALENNVSLVNGLEDTNTNLKAQNKILNRKLRDLFNLIDPFLTNLAKNPEKDIIKWPDRASKIQEFRERITQIINEEKPHE